MSDTREVVINLNDSNEDILAFIGDVVLDSTKAMFTLLKSMDDFNDVFSDQEIIVENFYPNTHNNDIFTIAYNIIGSVCDYVCSYFWGSK